MSNKKLKLVAKGLLFSFSIFQSIIVSGCSSTKELNSELFNGTSYRIDGRSDEWKGKKMLDLKNVGLMVGIQNDANNMYVCFMSSDKGTARRMAAAGMIVWLEPEHGKKFGIHYPLQMINPSAKGNVLYGYRTEMEILGPEKDAVAQSSILTSETDYGITAAFRDSSGLAVLELKIPRKAKEEPYGIGNDTVVNMTIESGKIDMPSGGNHQGSIGGGGRHRHGGGTQNGGTPSESGTQSSENSDRGRENAGERSGEAKITSNSISLNLRVHLAQ
jgi:hypothetical protein